MFCQDLVSNAPLRIFFDLQDLYDMAMKQPF